MDKENASTVKVMLQEHKRITVREIGDEVYLKRTVVHKIVTEKLNLSYVSADVSHAYYLQMKGSLVFWKALPVQLMTWYRLITM